MMNIAEHEVTGLDASFDEVIRGFPSHLIDAPDHPFLDPAFSLNPFPALAELRDRAGAVVRRGEDGLYAGTDIFNVWGHDLTQPHFVALSYKAVHEIGTDFRRFVSDKAYGAQQEAQGVTVNCADGKEHSNMRGLLDSAAFGRKQMQQRMDTLIKPTISYLVDRVVELLERGEAVDACRDLSLPAAYKSIATIIGVPQEKFSYFIELGEIVQSGPRDFEAAMRAIAEMDAFFADEFDKRSKDPKLDMLTALQTAERNDFKMTKEQIVQHCRFLLPGGIETTWRAHANMVMCLMLHPDQYRAVATDNTLVDQAVEETLRWAPSGFVVPRRCAGDTELEGTFIPEGSYICSIQGIANRDPEVWSDPDAFDIFRDKHDHLTFHAGKHFCMGQLLARGSIKELLSQLAEKLPTLQLACPPEEIEMRGFGVRCPAGVPLKI